MRALRKFPKQVFIIVICVFLAVPAFVFAIGGGGTGSGGGGGGNLGGGTTCKNYYGASDYYENSAAFRFDLVYKPKNGSRYIIKTVVANNEGLTWVSQEHNYSVANNLIKRYANAAGATYKNSGVLVNLATQLANGKTIDQLFNQNKLEDYETIKQYITSSGGFGVNEKDLQLEQDDNPGTYGSYGYRILIQRIQFFGTCVLTNTLSFYRDYGFAATRKDVASGSSIVRKLTGNSKTVRIAPSSSSAPPDIWTTRDDIGISRGSNHYYPSGGSGEAVNRLRSYFANWNDGMGYNILWFTTDPFQDHDYSYQASCASCKNTNSDYLAYTIKDTSDWNGIMASGSSTNTNVQSYYADGSYPSGDSQDPQGDVYCREEFEVYFPNALSQVYVEPGRYFLLNPEEKELNQIESASAIPNMKLHKVYRKRECQAEVNLTPYEKETYDHYLQRVYNAKRTTLSNYEKAKKEDFASKMGTVWFRYNETYEESKYNMDEPEEMLLYDAYREDPLTDYKNSWGDASYPDSKLVMENTTQYKLPDEYYQYIRLRDGLSMSKKPGEPFKDLGIENLPVSFENHGVAISSTQAKAADIQFAYDLPDNAMLKKAASNDGYLGTDSGNGGRGGDCIAKDTIMGEPTSGYSCIVLTSWTPIGDGCKTEADAKELGVDWNPKGGYCCPAGTKYNEETGNCDDGTTDSCDSEAEAKEQGRDWNAKYKYCCPVGTKYNASTGKCDGGFVKDCETEADANKLGVDWNKKYKYCCPAGTKYNPDSGTCDSNDIPDDGCDSAADAKEQGRDWNEKHNYCCPVGTKYNASNGKCEGTPPPSTGDECKTEADANKLGVDWNPVAKMCCAEGTTFNAETGKCSGGNEEDPVCPESECPYGCCPSGECAPMQTLDGQPLCPGFGARDVIYRTIDLENPFPGQNAEKRETGTNWCYFVAGSVTCSYNNPTVKGVITRERSGKTNGHKVYDENHVLYEITLDTRTIAAIRNYNKKHEYDDFELKCVDNGKYCFSEFLDNEVDISGKCDVDTKSAFISCDKDV